MALRILVCGTGPFAVPSFQRLLDTQHEIVALVTRPVADAGQRRKSAANPMRDLALSRGLTVHEPDSINNPDFVQTVRDLKIDLLVVCDYGQILSAECLQAARLGGINLHGSLLPRYRGAAPVAWAIWRGETTAGVSVIHMTGQLDGGPVVESAALAIGDNETCEQLEPRLSELGVDPVLRAIEKLEAWDGKSPLGKMQDPTLVTQARRLRKEDALVRWDRPAKRIANQIRALQPWPGTYTTWNRPARRQDGAEQPVRLIITRATAAEPLPDSLPDPGIQPGTVVVADGQQLHIQTGRGILSILEIQPAGKRPMPVADFLRGNPLAAGDVLGA